MSIYFGPPPAVSDSLLLYVDAANPRSYPGSGTSVTSLSPNQTSGTLLQGTAFSTANAGSFVFDGTDDRIQLDTVSASEFTIEVAFKTTGFSGLGGTVSSIAGTSGNDGYWWIQHTAQGLGNAFNYIQCSIFQNVISSNSLVPINVWNVVTVVKDSTGRYMYVNGILDSTEPAIGNTIYRPVSIGASITASRFYTGSIGYLKIYNRSLTGDEVWRNFSSVRARYGI